MMMAMKKKRRSSSGGGKQRHPAEGRAVRGWHRGGVGGVVRGRRGGEGKGDQEGDGGQGLGGARGGGAHLDELGVKHLLPALQALDVVSAGHALRDELPAVRDDLRHGLTQRVVFFRRPVPPHGGLRVRGRRGELGARTLARLGLIVVDGSTAALLCWGGARGRRRHSKAKKGGAGGGRQRDERAGRGRRGIPGKIVGGGEAGRCRGSAGLRTVGAPEPKRGARKDDS